MEAAKTTHSLRIPGVGLLLAVCLLVALVGTLAAYSPAQTATLATPGFSSPLLPNGNQLPRLLGLIKIPSGHGLTAQGVVHPNGLAYILNNSGSIVVLDGPRLVALMTWPAAERGRPQAIAIHPQTNHVYVTDERMSVIYLISGTHVITTVHDIGYGPYLLTAQPSNNLVYVVNVLRSKEEIKSSNVAVISDTKVITWVQINFPPHVMITNPFDHQVYVGHSVGWNGEKPHGILTIISNTQALTTTYLGPPLQEGTITDIAVNKQTGEMYMIQNYGTIVYWNGKQAKRLPVSKLDYSLNHIAVDTKRNLAYATSWDGPPSHVLVVREDQLLAALPVGYDPRAVVHDETHDYVYIANRLSGTMSVIRGTEVITTLDTLGWGATFITVDERRGYIYVSNSDSPSIAVFGFDQEPTPPPFWQTWLPWLGR